MRVGIFLLVFLCQLGAYCQTASTQWRQVAPATVNFVVSMPGQPLAEREVEKAKSGDLVNYTLTLEKSDVAYVAGYSDLPPEAKVLTSKASLDEFRKGMVGKSKLIAESEIVGQSFPGRNIKFRDADGLLYLAKVYVTGTPRIYYALATIPAQNEGSAAQSINYFLNSFQVRGKTPASAASSAPLPAQWKKFSPPKSGFAVSLPGVPTQDEGKTRKRPSAEDPYTLANGPLIYMVTYMDIDKTAQDNPDQALATIQSGLLEGFGNPKLLGTENLTHADSKGREIKFRDADGLLYLTRFFLVGQRVHILTAATAPEHEKTVTPDINRFFNSYELVE
jgi:hypothetical protein